jgi:hypothetical protein
MRHAIVAFGLGSLLLAGCATDPASADRSASRDEAYTPIGSNIPRRDARRVDVPIGSEMGTMTQRAGGGAPRN